MAESKTRVPSLRDRLAKKRARIVTEFFPLDEDGEKALSRHDGLERQIQLAEVLISGQNGKSDVDLDGLRKLRDEAAAERDAHCLALSFRGLSEDERDALESEFYTDDVPDKADADERKHIEDANLVKIKEWTYAAMAAATVDSDLTADDWRAELTSDRWSAGDVMRIRLAIQRAYGTQPADGIPKG